MGAGDFIVAFCVLVGLALALAGMVIAANRVIVRLLGVLARAKGGRPRREAGRKGGDAAGLEGFSGTASAPSPSARFFYKDGLGMEPEAVVTHARMERM